MKRAYAKSSYAKPYERYCREVYPAEAEQIFRRAEQRYREFMKDLPDLGANMMAKNMLDWFTILAFYEASDGRLDGEALLTIKRRAVERLRFLGTFVNGNKSKWIYRLFERSYMRFIHMQKAHQAKGEWKDSWQVEITPDRRTEGFCFHLIGCPSPSTPKRTAMKRLCRISARPTTSSPRSCTCGSFAPRSKRSAAVAAIIGLSTIKAQYLIGCGTEADINVTQSKNTHATR